MFFELSICLLFHFLLEIFARLEDICKLTTGECFDFLHDVLEINDPRESLSGDKVSFLNDVIHRVHHMIPWQVVYQRNDHYEDLTYDDIKQDMFARVGGGCFHVNVFMKTLLETLGFDAYFYLCAINNVPASHMGMAVRNLTFPGSVHVVDAGLQFPVFEAIPMDFDEESPIYQHSYLKHKYVKRPDGMVDWLHEARPNNISRKLTDDEIACGWLVHGTLDCFRANDLFTCINGIMKIMDPVTSKLGPRARIFINDQLLMIQTRMVVSSLPNNDLKYTPINSVEELFSLYQKYFPQFSKEVLEKVLSLPEVVDKYSPIVSKL